MTVSRILFCVLLALLPVLPLDPPRRPDEGTSPSGSRTSPRRSWPRRPPSLLRLRSESALVADDATQEILFEKNADEVRPIASLTKVMTGLVVLESGQSLSEAVTVTEEDVDTLKHSASHLPVGWTLTRGELLRIALTASDNRAAHALARAYPGGVEAFVRAMNAKAAALGMGKTRYVDPTGLDPANVSTARDLLLLAREVRRHETLEEIGRTALLEVRELTSGRGRIFGNSNGLIHDPAWDIRFTKTGYILESGYCLLMRPFLGDRTFTFVFLGAAGKDSRLGDARRTRTWLLGGEGGGGGRRAEGGRGGSQGSSRRAGGPSSNRPMG